MKNVTDNQNTREKQQDSSGVLFDVKKSMVDERNLMHHLSSGCRILFDWDDEDTADYVRWIDGEPYCATCADEMEARALEEEF